MRVYRFLAEASSLEPAEGLEPPTFGLQIRCTTSYATQATNCPRHLPLMNETDGTEEELSKTGKNLKKF